MKIAIIGDSISEGIGNKKINYCQLLKSEFDQYEFKNFSLTGTTIKYAQQKTANIINYKPNILIICYGQVDALTRVKTNTLTYKMIPDRYKGLGMLDPRALYTSKYPKRIFQKLDSIFRYNLKKSFIKTQGYSQWVDVVDFKNIYDAFILNVHPHVDKILLLSTVNINDYYFPYCTRELEIYNDVIKKLAFKHKLKYIDIYSEFKKYKYDEIFLHDHFHPNTKGYRVIADLIKSQLIY